MNDISLLLGAGFSVNKGFPTANELNNKITDLKDYEFCVAQQGSVCWLKPGQEDPFIWSEYHTMKLFTLNLISYYASRNDFNYEEFYDFYSNVNKEGHKDDGFENMCEEFRAKYNTELDNVNLISKHNSIFNQLIAIFLVDGGGNKFYEPVRHVGVYQGYQGFLNCIRNWGLENIVHINSLNHDLFFESLNYTDAIDGKLSAGFEELGSVYYGEIQDGLKIRLARFTGNYSTNYRLYKLHGSVDQYPFHKTQTGEIDNYIKIKPGVGITDLYKEEHNEEGALVYINDFINYYPDFLSGTTSKILRYREPIYYETIFNIFGSTLKNSKKLVIVGYGFCDSEINKIILENFHGKVFVVDPFPQAKTHEFCELSRAELIVKTPEEISIEDFRS